MTDKQSYEVLERISFGYLRNDDGSPKEDSAQPENSGLVEPTPEGQDNPVISLTDEEAKPLLESGAIKPAGSPDPVSTTDNPEEDGYEGEAARDAALKSESKPPSKAKPAKSKE